MLWKKKLSNNIIFILSVSINPAYAYLDPGNASLIIQTILAFIAGAVVTEDVVLSSN